MARADSVSNLRVLREVTTGRINALIQRMVLSVWRAPVTMHLAPAVVVAATQSLQAASYSRRDDTVLQAVMSGYCMPRHVRS